MLKPMLNDSALLSKFFGVETPNAARALIQGTDALQGFTDAVTGTNSATEQAAIIMDSLRRTAGQSEQQFEDLKISIFQATGDFFLWWRCADFGTGAGCTARAVAYGSMERAALNSQAQLGRLDKVGRRRVAR